jgi:hypothetical protein
MGAHVIEEVKSLDSREINWTFAFQAASIKEEEMVLFVEFEIEGALAESDGLAMRQVIAYLSDCLPESVLYQLRDSFVHNAGALVGDISHSFGGDG